jgi:two-component system, LytTR family, sensor kinase
MKNTSWRYWLCQIVGWGVWCLFGLYLSFWVYEDSFKAKYSTNSEQLAIVKNKYFAALIITFISAILVTHLLRFILKKIDWLRFSFNNLLYIFFIGAITSGFLLYIVSDTAEKGLNVSIDEYRADIMLQQAQELETNAGLKNVDYYSAQKNPLSYEQKAHVAAIKKNTGWERNEKGEWIYPKRSNLAAIYQAIILVALWLLVYFVWHYVVRNRKDQIDRIRLETTVKELELKTIKAHINPHFIFNSLNSIRALVDENPQRARDAITELSNLLRSSMQAEKNETVTLEKEMKIVEDYLALEKIRFEDRLNVELYIDEDTLDQQVPPMMVQTLVENAIKHGISKQMQGGIIKIHSDFVNSHYELRVENTGTLNESVSPDGFGLKSTQDRLKLLFGGNSSFNIKQATDNTVAVTVALPVKINT